MMTRLQFLLTKLAEEGSEVSQIALKAQQFGLNECRAETTVPNRERIYAELNDLLGIVDLLNSEYDFGFAPDPAAIRAKKEKVETYYQYSVTLGKVEPK